MPYKNKDEMHEYQREYWKRPEIKERRRQQRRERYRSDPDYRERLQTKSRVYRSKHDKIPNSRYRLNSGYREKKLAYMRDYQRKLRDLARNNPNDPKAQRFIQYRRKYQREDKAKRSAESKVKLTSLLGDSCILCERKIVVFHQIYGQRHPYYNFEYQVQHKDDFAPLCVTCHRMVHRMMKLLGINWKTILRLKAKYRRNSS